MSSKSTIWSRKTLESTVHFGADVTLKNFLNSYWMIGKGKNALLLMGENFLARLKIQFPRERVAN